VGGVELEPGAALPATGQEDRSLILLGGMLIFIGLASLGLRKGKLSRS
jgi:LPXTG-motif cell wall-anchored protein